MFNWLKRQDIDVKKWDECILQSSQKLIYGLSWYLDTVSPQWEALVKIENEKYVAVLPLTIRKKFGISYLVQPFFTQQLGLYSASTSARDFNFLLNEILSKYLFINYNFNYGNNLSVKSVPDKSIIKERTTYVLSLHSSYAQLTGQYSVNHKRNIKKALRSGVSVREGNEFTEVVDVFRRTKGGEVSELKEEHYENLFEIYEACKKRGCQKLYIAVDRNNKILAGGLFLFFGNRIIYLFGASSAEGKEHSAMMLLFDEIIKKYSDTEYLLDFEGGEISGIGRFYRGFGGVPVQYYRISVSKIPFISI